MFLKLHIVLSRSPFRPRAEAIARKLNNVIEKSIDDVMLDDVELKVLAGFPPVLERKR